MVEIFCGTYHYKLFKNNIRNEINAPQTRKTGWSSLLTNWKAPKETLETIVPFLISYFFE
jgi:hypothetical protein